MTFAPLAPLRRLVTGRPEVVAFVVPDQYRIALASVIHAGVEKHGDRYKVIVATPKRPRTTGDHSQNHWINGAVQRIAAQSGNDFNAVKMHLKTLAINAGWPFETLPDGTIMPRSEAEASVEEASILIETIQRFAAEWGFDCAE